MTNQPNTAQPVNIILPRQTKSIWAAFFLTLLFGPIGLLYASIAGGIILSIVAILLGLISFGVGALIAWPLSIIWAVTAAILSKRRSAVRV